MPVQKIAVVRNVWPHVRWIQSRNAYQVDLRTGEKGVGRREFYPTREKALAAAGRAAELRKAEGHKAIRSDELAKYGKTVNDAVQFYLAHLRSAEASKPVAETIAALLMERADMAPSYLVCLKIELRRFETFAGDRSLRTMADIKLEHLNEYLRDSQTAGTRNTRRKHLSTLFTFAEANGWIPSNPVRRVEKRKVEYDVATLTAAQMRRLLAGCDALGGETAADAMRAYIALAGFAGIRPEELHKLNWRDVNLSEGFVDIRSNVSKVKEARLVRLSENCKAWLAPCAARVGVVAPKTGFRYRFDAVRAAAGFSVRGNKGEPWPANVLRHSYASCWLPIHKNRAELAELMGNSPAIIGKHYRRPIPQAEAEEWFAIWPEAEGSKIIAMA
jgi:integrase